MGQHESGALKKLSGGVFCWICQIDYQGRWSIPFFICYIKSESSRNSSMLFGFRRSLNNVMIRWCVFLEGAMSFPAMWQLAKLLSVLSKKHGKITTYHQIMKQLPCRWIPNFEQMIIYSRNNIVVILVPSYHRYFRPHKFIFVWTHVTILKSYKGRSYF